MALIVDYPQDSQNQPQMNAPDPLLKSNQEGESNGTDFDSRLIIKNGPEP